MIRCLIIDVTERRHNYEWKFETRILMCNTATLLWSDQRRERIDTPGVL